MCLVMASVPLCYKYLFLYDFLFIHPKVFIDFCRKRLFGLFGNIRPLLFWKNNCSESVCILTSQQNIQGGIPVKYTHRPSWDFSKKLFRAAII